MKIEPIGREEVILGLFTEMAPATLEIGCGSGSLLNKIKKRSKIAVGIDMNFDYFDKRYTTQNINLINANAENLPFKSHAFDAVVMSDVLEHLFNQYKAISEVDRVLKNGGIFLITAPNKSALDFLDVLNLKNRLPALYVYFNKIFKIKKKDKISTIHESRIHRHYSVGDIKKALPKNFKILNKQYHGFFLCYTIDILSSLYKKITKKTSGFLNKIAKYDYCINYGPISYALALKLKKCKNSP